MDTTSIAARLRLLISNLGLTDSQFADQCGISRATLSLLLSGKNKKVSDVLLSQIHNEFPRVSIIWLLFNEGGMFASESSDLHKVENDGLNKDDLLFGDDSFTEGGENQNLMPVNKLDEIIKKSVSQAFEPILNSNSFLLKKLTEEDKKRKVMHITVYYDDSTFETFMPESL